MAMTIGVYRVDPKTQERTTLRETQTVTGNEPLPPGSAYPGCSCPRCPPRGSSRTDRDF